MRAPVKSTRKAKAKATHTFADRLYQVENLIPPYRAKVQRLARIFGLTLTDFVRDYHQHTLPGQPKFERFKLKLKLPKTHLVLTGPVPPYLSAVFTYYGGVQEWSRSQFRGGVVCDLGDHLFHPTTGEILESRAVIWDWFNKGRDVHQRKEEQEAADRAAEEKLRRRTIEVNPAAPTSFTVTVTPPVATVLHDFVSKFPHLSPAAVIAQATNEFLAVLVDCEDDSGHQTFAAHVAEMAPDQQKIPEEATQGPEMECLLAILRAMGRMADADEGAKGRCRELAARLVSNPTKLQRNGMLMPLAMAIGSMGAISNTPGASSEAKEIAEMIASEAPVDIALNASPVSRRRRSQPRNGKGGAK